MAVTLNALNPTNDINTMVQLANNQQNLTNPEVFYNKQLLDTIRMDADQYKYYKVAVETPIQDKADKLTMRRWAPLEAHTVPLAEGIPPKSDKGSVEKYELEAFQYGRFMEFTDKVDFNVVDPVVAHYTREYSIVAMETLDILAREALALNASQYFAGAAEDFEALTTPIADKSAFPASSKPSLADLRLIVLNLKRKLVRPLMNGNFKVICSPEFTFDMVEDPLVSKYFQYNNTTKDTYEGNVLFPMFNLSFDESLVVPANGTFFKDGKVSKRIYRVGSDGAITVATINTDTPLDSTDPTGDKVYSKAAEGAFRKDPRTMKDASYIPEMEVWNIDSLVFGADADDDWAELMVHHIYVLGKDCLTRTGLTGEGNAKTYVKPLGSAGVLDPIDQRQSIGFKINSVGFGSVRPEAIVDYMCIPSTANPGLN